MTVYNLSTILKRYRSTSRDLRAFGYHTQESSLGSRIDRADQRIRVCEGLGMIRLYCMKAQLRAGKTHGWLLCLLPASLQIERSVESIAERLVTKEVAFLYLFISTCEDRLGGGYQKGRRKVVRTGPVPYSQRPTTQTFSAAHLLHICVDKSPFLNKSPLYLRSQPAQTFLYVSW